MEPRGHVGQPISERTGRARRSITAPGGYNRRSLRRQLLIILEAAAGHDARSSAVDAPSDRAPRDALTIEELAELSRALFPRGTQSSVAYIRQLRDSR
jgi:hypothetical protein